MQPNLEQYLLEISYYLAVKEGGEDILSEIKAHILEKTEREFGTVTDEGVEKVIAGYGQPQHVAAQYIDGVEIISPTLKKHLFVYTGILFVCHFALTVVAFLFQSTCVGFPFLFIPRMESWQLLLYVPMALIYDLGLVVIFLYFVTQKKRDLRLPWPKLLQGKKPRKDMKRPNIIFLVLLTLVFAFLLFLLVRFGTVFFVSADSPGNMLPLFGPDASLYYSLLFLAMFGCEILGYATRS